MNGHYQSVSARPLRARRLAVMFSPSLLLNMKRKELVFD